MKNVKLLTASIILTTLFAANANAQSLAQTLAAQQAAREAAIIKAQQAQQNVINARLQKSTLSLQQANGTPAPVTPPTVPVVTQK